MTAIFILSTGLFGESQTGGILEPVIRFLFPSASDAAVELIHHLIRKAAHFTEYAVLATLWFRALTRGSGVPFRRAILTAFIISAVYAASDEFHQYFVPSRTASVYDAMLDASGAAAACLFLHVMYNSSRREKGKAALKGKAGM